jgi:hypothetical protein
MLIKKIVLLVLPCIALAACQKASKAPNTTPVSTKSGLPTPEYLTYPKGCWGEERASDNTSSQVCRLTFKPQFCTKQQWQRLNADNGIDVPYCKGSETVNLKKKQNQFTLKMSNCASCGYSLDLVNASLGEGIALSGKSMMARPKGIVGGDNKLEYTFYVPRDLQKPVTITFYSYGPGLDKVHVSLLNYKIIPAQSRAPAPPPPPK